ncbi:MAG: type I-E CRISPR-associated protein Cas5/CasD [Treponema sp.]|nr:type I-E CRISPR-associated protein Cas5/CasD [Treponema sp.]
MNTQWLFLWLEAPLQSWGYDSKFNRRDTLEFPTKSGVLGLLLCALGASGKQVELLARFSSLRQTVISYRYKINGEFVEKLPFLHDFQMIGSGYNDNNAWENFLIPKKADGSSSVGGGTKLTHRYYLQNSLFAVLLEVPDDIAENIAFALQNPVYPIYLGRKCCIPSDYVYQGIFATPEEAELAAMTKAEEKALFRNEYEKSSGKWKLAEDFRVIDGESSEGDVFTLNDIPLQFGTVKKYKDRRVTKIIHE